MSYSAFPVQEPSTQPPSQASCARRATAEHSANIAAPAELLYVPAEQGLHSLPPAAVVFPAAHDLQLEAPVPAPYVPAPQSSHAVAPAAAANLPTASSVVVAKASARNAARGP